MKKSILLVLLLVSVVLVGCATGPWRLVAEGVLTDYAEVRGEVIITFDNNRAVRLGGWALEEPSELLFGEYYYLYKEDGDAVWRGYHLLSDRR